MFVGIHDPTQKLPKQRKRRIGDYYIGFVTQGSNLFTTEIPIFFEVIPFEVMKIYATIAIYVMIEDEYFPVNRSLRGVELRSILLEQ